MILVGDVACPDKESSDKLEDIVKKHGEIFSGKKLICNLEGLITDKTDSNTATPVLFSHKSITDAINSDGNLVTALANNHTLDLPGCYEMTKKHLIEQGIPFTGSGKSAAEAAAPAEFFDGQRKVFLYNYCWDFLLYHQKNPSNGVHVAVIDEMKLIETVQSCRSEHPDASIIVYFHWSIDLEVLPYPMYRRFSKTLIDNGVNLVAGCHSHCVQGGERYRDGYIVYGLGNFYIPWNVYANGKLKFPEFSKVTLALEWDPVDNSARCHWFEYQESDKTLKLLESEHFDDSIRLKSFSPFAGMSDKEYVNYFRANRRKKFLIPVYKNHENVLWNRFLTFMLKARARTARRLAEVNLIKWQS